MYIESSCTLPIYALHYSTLRIRRESFLLMRRSNYPSNPEPKRAVLNQRQSQKSTGLVAVAALANPCPRKRFGPVALPGKARRYRLAGRCCHLDEFEMHFEWPYAQSGEQGYAILLNAAPCRGHA